MILEQFAHLRHQKEWWAMLVHSFSIIGFQIVLMRILELTQWNHFSSLIIGLALLGFGVSGTFLSLFKVCVVKQAAWFIPFSMMLSSISMLLAFRLSQSAFFQFDSLLVFYSFKEFVRFFSFILLFVIPFFFAATAVGSMFVVQQQRVSALYYANLFGSGLGGILALLLLNFFVPEQALLLTTIFSLPATLFLLSTSQRIRFVPSFLFYLFLFFHWLFFPPSPIISSYKTLSKVLLLPDAHVEFKSSGITSTVHIVSSAYLRNAPGLSLHFQDSVPVQPLLLVNGNFFGFITVQGKPGFDILDYTTQNLPYVFNSYKNVMVVSGGSGSVVHQALCKGASSVTVFEADRDVVEALDSWNPYLFPSIYNDSRVRLVKFLPRSFLPLYRDSFDLVVLPGLGSFGGNAGLDALSENYNMTRQSLGLFWDKLQEDGCLTVTIYLDYPPRAVLRALNSFVQMLVDSGVLEVEQHLLAICSWNDVTFVVSKTPLSEHALAKSKEFCNIMGFQSLLPRGLLTYSNHVDDPADSLLLSMTRAGLDRNKMFTDDYLFDIGVVDDNRPFFSKFIKLCKLPLLLKMYPWHEVPYLELGYVLLWSSVLLMLVLSLIFILLPVFWMKSCSGKAGVFIYFGSVGIGFMFVEIILIQYFNHFFNQALLSVTMVLSALLMGSGFGSWFSGRISSFGSYHRSLLLFLIGIIICYAFFLPGILLYILSYPFVIKVFICVILVGFPSFLMGMPFPLALGSYRISNLVPWAWGVNGFFSVIATPLALIMAIEYGFRMVLIVAGLFYFLAFLAVRQFYK